MPARSQPATGPLDHLAWLASRFLLITAALVVAATGLVVAGVVVLPLFLGLLVTAGVDPLARRLRARGLPPAVASLAAVGAVAVVAVLVTIGCVSAIVDQWPSISASIEEAVDRLEELSTDHLGIDPDTADETGSDVRRSTGTIVSVLVRGVVRIVPTITTWMTAITLSLIVAFFFLRDGRTMWRAALDLVPDDHRPAFEVASREAWQAVAGFVRGTAVIAAVDAAVIGLGAWVLGVPSPLAITLLTAAAGFIPLLGATLAGGFAVLLALGADGFGTAAAMLVVVLVVQQLESNFLQPVVLGRTTALHPLVTMLVVVAGGAFGGIVGMLLAVPLTAGAVAAVRALRRAGWPDDGPTPVG
ncbi:MAG TPA: AI-2E family transporter [Iamia sp.]